MACSLYDHFSLTMTKRNPIILRTYMITVVCFLQPVKMGQIASVSTQPVLAPRPAAFQGHCSCAISLREFLAAPGVWE